MLPAFLSQKFKMILNVLLSKLLHQLQVRIAASVQYHGCVFIRQNIKSYTQEHYQHYILSENDNRKYGTRS